MAKFTWGDAVEVVESAPEKYRRIGAGSVCGMDPIKTQVLADEYGEPIGTLMYIVEGAKGWAIEIPERFLKLYVEK